MTTVGDETRKKKCHTQKSPDSENAEERKRGDLTASQAPTAGLLWEEATPHTPLFVGDRTHGAYRPASLRAGSGRIVLPDLSCVGGSVA